MVGKIWQRFLQTRIFGMDIHPSARIASSAFIDRTYPRGIHIEADVTIDEEAVVLSHDMVRGVYLHTRIGASASIGPRAIILPGMTVGKNAVVMPGALVSRDVPDGATVMGNPARLVEPDAQGQLQSA
jgi:serine acetyltransferase